MKTWRELREIQPLATKIIVNSLKRNRVSHAYLIQGQRGTGKKELATLFTMTLFCPHLNEMEPCQRCHICKRIVSRNHPDVLWIEPDGESIKNEQIKTLRKEFSYTGLESAKKVYIIDQAHTLTVNATNRMLKFLEEPDSDITALLLTDQGQQIIPTIRSRCQIIELKPLDESAFQHTLIQTENNLITENKARLLSALTNNIDEALALHTEEKVYKLKELIEEFIYVLLTKYDERYLFLHEKWLREVKERNEHERGLDLLLLAFRDILMKQIDPEHSTSFFEREDALLTRATKQFTQYKLLQQLNCLLEARQKMNDHVHPTLVMEQLVLKL